MASNRRRYSLRALAADTGLAAVLVDGARLPLKHWRERFFFTGGPDPMLYAITGGRFPRTPDPGKTHPVFALSGLPDGAGFRVCPCSSKKPAPGKAGLAIRKGCILTHTGHVMDRRSHLITHVTFNIPPSVARDLRFRGEVPEDCIES